MEFYFKQKYRLLYVRVKGPSVVDFVLFSAFLSTCSFFVAYSSKNCRFKLTQKQFDLTIKEPLRNILF